MTLARLAILACLAPLPAFAHAFLTRAVPGVGTTVAKPPGEVALDFSEAVEPHFCTVVVLDAAGTRVDHDDLHGAGPRLVIGVGRLAPGAYRVVWHAVSVDTHRTEGSFGFTVAP